jgi:thiamine-monophosphate kinase
VPLSTPVSESRATKSDLRIGSLGERGLVALIRRRFPAPPGLLHIGIGDDAAVAAPARGELDVLTTDCLVEGVHFDLAFSTPADVGFKSLAVNVSDVAAMGGTPRLALLSLILPDWLTIGDIESLLDGFAEMAQHANVALAGGNITRSPGPLIVDVSVAGSVRPRRVLSRGGGRPGDGLYVTGIVGAAAAGLGWLRDNKDRGASAPADPDLAACVERYRRPMPRLRLGSVLGRTRTAGSCMDLSDGLADAVRQVAEASGTGAAIDAAALPLSPSASRWFTAHGIDPVRAALAGGDDYELLFSVSPRRRGRLRTAIQQARGLEVTRIGELTPSREVVLRRDGGSEPLPEGFTHF